MGGTGCGGAPEGWGLRHVLPHCSSRYSWESHGEGVSSVQVGDVRM